MNIKKLFGLVKVEFDKHSPEILTGLGIAGSFAAVIFTVQATSKATKAIEKKKKELKKEKLNVGETIQATWKYYIPTAVTLAASTACSIGANSVNTRRNAALAAAYSLSETALTEYQDKVKETLGERKERDIQTDIERDRIIANPPTKTNIIYTGKGDRLFQLDGQYFMSDWDEIQNIELEIGKMMVADADFNDGFISKNDVHYLFGIDCSDPTDDDIGWTRSYGYVEFVPDPILLPNKDVCTVLRYKNRPNTIKNSRNFHLL